MKFRCFADRPPTVRVFPLIVSGLGLGACTVTEPDIGDPDLARLQVQVSYEPDAAPYTGTGPGGVETWSIFRTNTNALFEGTAVEVDAPSRLEDMQALPDLPESEFSVERLLEIDATWRTGEVAADTKVLHVIFVDGYLLDDEGRQEGVLGVSIGNTGVIAMFKPVIATLGITDAVRRFGEQATLVHEVGHGIGLVNNGLPMEQDHQDEEHGAHCDDDTCVMFWANEGVGDLAEFVGRYLTTGNSVIFDEDCIADVRASF